MTVLRRHLICVLALMSIYLFAGSPQDRDYNQPYRPQFHFSPRINWTNDPNGLVYFEGEYHIFFQYNPFGDQWGHMSWGHAVSTDLVHWKELPVAIPESATRRSRVRASRSRRRTSPTRMIVAVPGPSTPATPSSICT